MRRVARRRTSRHLKGAHYLRSSREVIGYQIAGSDVECGHVDDFIFDDELWTIRHLVVDISNWPGRRTVLLSPLSVREIDWSQKKIHVDGPAERICNGPEYSRADTSAGR